MYQMYINKVYIKNNNVLQYYVHFIIVTIKNKKNTFYVKIKCFQHFSITLPCYS